MQCFEIKIISKQHFQEHQTAANYAAHYKSCWCSLLSSNQISCDPGGFPGSVCASPMACLHWTGRMDSTFLLFLSEGSQFCQLEMGVKKFVTDSFRARPEQGLRLGANPACVPLAVLLLIQTRTLLPTWAHVASCSATVNQLPQILSCQATFHLSSPSLECLE